VDGIIFEEMDVPGDVGAAINGHQLQVLIPSGDDAGQGPADAAEPVDGHLYWHATSRFVPQTQHFAGV
jgi:hypothetical protein